ncbi:unnamed protein product [Sympodiomycopsis kandeliae]
MARTPRSNTAEKAKAAPRNLISRVNTTNQNVSTPDRSVQLNAPLPPTGANAQAAKQNAAPTATKKAPAATKKAGANAGNQQFLDVSPEKYYALPTELVPSMAHQSANTFHWADLAIFIDAQLSRPYELRNSLDGKNGVWVDAARGHAFESITKYTDWKKKPLGKPLEYIIDLFSNKAIQ